MEVHWKNYVYTIGSALGTWAITAAQVADTAKALTAVLGLCATGLFLAKTYYDFRNSQKLYRDGKEDKQGDAPGT